MDNQLKPKTSEINAKLWGAHAQDWADIQEGTARSAYEVAIERAGVGPGTRYLDVGCGSGMAAQIASSRGAVVTGIDAAQELLEIAKSRVKDGDFRIGDLEELPFADQSFDVVTGFNAFQYAGNPVVALEEARRVTKPGGSIIIMTWGNPEGMEAATLVKALGPLMPSPPPGAAGPFALSDDALLRKFATDAGLTPVEIFDAESPFAYKDEATGIRGLNSSGVAARAMDNSSEDAVIKAHAEALAPYRKADGSYCAIASFRCLLARP